MSKTLGLDLGTNSIGWALIDDVNNEILAMGSRIFPEGVDKIGDGEGKEISKNAGRTANRGARRQHFRRRFRKRYLLRELAKQGFTPFSFEQVKVWTDNSIFGTEEFKNWVKLNPYELRGKALKEKITLEELGRVFYHMIQRRGFQSNSRSASKEEGTIFKGVPKEGKIGIDETRKSIEEYDTLGAYLSSISPKENTPFKNGLERIRNRYTTRQMYVEEFEKLWNAQKRFHPNLTDELKTKIGGRKRDGYPMDGILFHQRPLRSQKHLVGKCTFEPNNTKSPISAIPFEKFRVYQWVNTVECNGKKLNDDDKSILVEELFKKSKVKFSALRRKLKKADAGFQFNFKDDDSITGTDTISNLSNKKFFGKEWDKFTEKEQEDIWHVLYDFEDVEKLKEYAQKKWGFDEEKAERISKFNLKDGYSNLSRKAINNILPFLKKGFTYDIAVALGGVKNAYGKDWETLDDERKEFIANNMFDIVRSGKVGGYIEDLKEFLKKEFQFEEDDFKKLYHHSANIKAKQILKKLPLGDEADKEIESIRNPIVITALFELRKLVNGLLDEYGEIKTMKVEMARDLKVSKTARNEIRRKQQFLERQNERVIGELKKLDQVITHESITKYKLWEECDKTCPYTGKKISLSELFTGNIQIEHIIPWSRSLNDSFMNKTLCFADENRKKGNQTPYEFYNKQGKEKWEKIKEQALNCFKTKSNYPDAYRKFKQFVKTKIDDDFVSRQLNDTRYISKEAKNYLSKICEDVQVATGQTTANLRQKWGLNNILSENHEKNRNDHRHHAVDALVVAATKRSYLQKLSTWNRYGRTHELNNFPMPWESFRADAEKKVHKILISHKKNKNVLTVRNYKTKKDGKTYVNKGVAARGQLHKEKVFGKRTAPLSETAYHIRKPIESLKKKNQVDKVVDRKIRELIHQRIDELGGYVKGVNIPDGTFYITDEKGNTHPQLFLPNKNGDKVPIYKVRMKEQISNAAKVGDDNINQYVNPRNNHHVLLYEDENGKINEDVVSFWKAVERKKQEQEVVQLPPTAGKGKIITTLSINDMFLLGLKEEDINWKNPDYKMLAKHLYRVQKVSSKYYTFRLASEATLENDQMPYLCRMTSFGEKGYGWKALNPIKVKLSVTGKISQF